MNPDGVRASAKALSEASIARTDTAVDAPLDVRASFLSGGSQPLIAGWVKNQVPPPTAL